MARLNIKCPNTVPRPHGFTLIEVLVALAVIAIAMGAIIRSVGQTVQNIAYIRDKTFAHWVAMNRLAEIQVLGLFPSGTDTGSEQMAGQEWYWKTTSTDLDKTYPDVKQIQIEVRRNRDAKEFLVKEMGLVARKDDPTRP
ncbi:MAG: type II secretion system minor pseudopilin GspI [Gammaproteobacteria bacterium]|nr:type II secretion system minor pseudopilin GspI [Gammaproteobacteria bacterium]